MDPQNQPQFNPKIPISEVLKQEQAGYTPSAPKATLNDVVTAMRNTYNDTNNVAYTPTQAVAPEGNNQTNPSQIKIIKTYKSDAADAIRSQQEVSTAKIVMAQEAERRMQGEEIGVQPKKRHVGLLLMAIILIIIGAASIPTVQYFLNQKSAAVPVVAEKTIIPFDHQDSATLNNATRDDLLAALNVVSVKQPIANVEYIKVLENIQDANQKTVTQTIAPDIFAGLVGPNMPSALARSFDSQYMFGTENSKPFILFKTSSYQQTFANMLKWETKMITDLSPVLNLSTATFGRPFSDQVVISKDVRAVTAIDGTVLFLYGFLDNQTLIITTDTQTFQDLNSRYVASQFVQ